MIYRMDVRDKKFSRWIALCLLFKNIQLYRWIRYVLPWESLILKLKSLLLILEGKLTISLTRKSTYS